MPGDRSQDLMAAAGYELQSQVAAALALFVTGDMHGVRELLGLPDDIASAAAAAPLLCAFSAARAAINAAVGDDPTRGYAALATLQERSVEYAAKRDESIGRHETEQKATDKESY